MEQRSQRTRDVAAPGSDLRDLQGRYTALSHWWGRRILLVFLQPDCPYSRAILPVIAGLPLEPFAGGLLPVIVTAGQVPENRILAETYGIRCPVLVQDDAEVFSQYGVEGTPASCLIDERGRVVGGTEMGATALVRRVGITVARRDGWEDATTACWDAGDWAEHLVRAHRAGVERSASHRIPLGQVEMAQGHPYAGAPPLVTVVLPTRDRPQLLRMALEYYRRQTYRSRELIVVDDGSRFPADRDAIAQVGGRLIRVEVGTPLGAKLNRGVSEARGSLCQKWDDDDWYAPRFLETLASEVLRHTAGTGEPALGYLTRCRWFDLRQWQIHAPARKGPWGATLHFRREKWERCPFREIRLGEDGWFVVDQLKAGVAPVPLYRPDLYLAVRHGGAGEERDHAWKQANGASVEEVLRSRSSKRSDPSRILPDWALAEYRALQRQSVIVTSRTARSATVLEARRARRLARARPNLLYLAPFSPAFTGRGSPIHGAMMLEALAERYRVYLVIVPMWDHEMTEVAESIDALCEEWAVVPPVPCDDVPLVPRPVSSDGGEGPMQPAPRLWSRASRETLQDVLAQFGNVGFEVVHSLRLHMAPFAEPYLNRSSLPRPQWHMDLNEVESINRARIAALYRLNGNRAEAENVEDESRRYAAVESHVLPRCDRIYVCSRLEQEAVRARYGCPEVQFMPNVVTTPPECSSAPESNHFTFLFVGTFGYYPNEDAALYLCSEIIPLLREQAKEPFRVVLIGYGDISTELKRGARHAGVELAGFVPDLAPWYAGAHVVVAPPRAGTGTRIKILEAMSHRLPVVSTSIGCEGLEVRDGVHLLIGDTAQAFAGRCLRLMSDARERERLGGNGFEFCVRYHSPEVLRRMLAPSTTTASPAYDTQGGVVPN